MSKLISWNVNGIRAIIKKGFYDFINEYNPDVICIQETKAHPEQVTIELDNYPYQYWNSAEKRGYSGTAIFSKIKPLNIINGIGISIHDNEGRVITLEFLDYYLVTVYTPNSKRDLSRLEYRYKNWDPDFINYISTLEKQKPVIFCGDLNVAHTEKDLANPKTNRTRNNFPGNAGFTDEERSGFDNIIDQGFIDTFRYFNPEPGHYSWWSYRANARERNIGWRIDYFCISPKLIKNINSSIILKEIMGSDHAPILLNIS